MELESSRGHPIVAGAAATVLTAVAYLPGIGRSLNYDAAESVGFFVVSGSAGDSLRTQRSFNNHPLFSFFEHLVVDVTGRTDEWVLRILPIGFAAIAVGLLVWAVHRRLGLLAAIAAGFLLATNPLFVEQGRSVRGYSLLVLAALTSTLILLEVLPRPSTRWRVGYVVAAVTGLMTHLFMAPVILIHAVEVGRRRALDRTWVTLYGCIGVLTVVFYIRTVGDLLGEGDRRGRVFQPDFPLDLARELLGHETAAVLALGAIVVIWLRSGRPSPAVLTFALASTATIFAAWIAAPQNLAPRFFIWLVPAVGLPAARLVYARWRPVVTASLVAVGITGSIAGSVSGYTSSPNAYPEVAELVERAADAGANVCVTDLSVPPLLAYTREFEAVVDLDALAACDVVAIAEPGLDRAFVEAADAEFSHRLDIDRRDPAVVFARPEFRWTLD